MFGFYYVNERASPKRTDPSVWISWKKNPPPSLDRRRNSGDVVTWMRMARMLRPTRGNGVHSVNRVAPTNREKAAPLGALANLHRCPRIPATYTMTLESWSERCDAVASAGALLCVCITPMILNL